MKIKKILVSQPKPESEKSPYFDIAGKYNVKIDFRPFIKVEPILAKEFRQQHVNIADYNAIVFTSRHGIDHFFRLAEEMRIKIAPELQYFCVSEKIAHYLQKYIDYRKRKVHYGTTNRICDLAPVIQKHKELNYLAVLSADYNDEIPNLMQKVGVKYNIGMMYRTVSNDFGPDEQLDYDMMLFFSPQGINALLKNFPNYEQGDVMIGCLGSNTAAAVRNAGLRLDLEVPSPQFTSITMALDALLKENHKRK